MVFNFLLMTPPSGGQSGGGGMMSMLLMYIFVIAILAFVVFGVNKFLKNVRDTDLEVSDNFKILYVLSKLISVVGWIVTTIGSFLFISTILTKAFAPDRDIAAQIFSNIVSHLFLGKGFIILVVGLVMVTAGHLIRCIVAIEYNTR